MTDSDTSDRALGALLGLAVGDALGAPLEFLGRDMRAPVTEMLGGGAFNLEPGEWTDDTAMAMALAKSLLFSGGLDVGDLARRFVSWMVDGAYSCTGECFDIGMATRESLVAFQRTGNPLSGSPDEGSAGNGSIMRLAPVAIFSWRNRAEAVRMARQQSLVTHAAPQALDACSILGGTLVDLIGGDEPSFDTLTPVHPALHSIVNRDYRHKTRDDISSSGYVVSTLEAALWAVASTHSFEDALVLAVNLADDADTVGAVTGQIAGARYGATAIPQRWLARLAEREHITDIARQLMSARS